MTNAELIKALRYCEEHEGCDYYIAKDCPREDTWVCGADCEQILMHDAADALEAADKRINELTTKCNQLQAQIPKRGEWISSCDGFEWYVCCSVCGEEALIKEGGSHDHAYSHYCPNCGARMRGEHDEE